MIKWHPAIALALLAAGCGKEPTLEERARSDAADVASVEAAQDAHPPVQPIMPEPITFKDVQRHNLSGAGCSFTPHGAAQGRPILVTLQQRAVFKLDGSPFVLAANPGSSELPFGAHAEYAGRAHGLRLAKDTADPSDKPGRWQGSVTFTDQFERPVFTAHGTFDCGV
jgi:hypothetical protein